MADFDPKTFSNMEDAFSSLMERLKNGESFDALKKHLQASAEWFKSSTQQTGIFEKALIGAANQVKNLAAQIAQMSVVSDVFKKVEETANSLKSKLGDSGISTAAFATKMALISPAALKMTEIPAQFLKIGEAAKETQAQLTDMITKNPAAFKAMGDAFEAAFGYKGVDDDIKRFAQYVDATRNMEKGMVMVASATGNFSEMMKKVNASGDLSAGLEKAATGYNQMAITIARATGTSAQQAAEFANKLMMIPGALKDINQTETIAGTQISLAAAAMKLATGTGQEYGTILTDLGFSFEELGLKGEQSLEFINRIHEASDATGIPLEKMRIYAKDTAKEFALLGDNTDGVIDIMDRMGPALMKSGASVSQTMDIMKNMTTGMHEMSTGAKAFLSASTGGPGGLQGAFQIEQMLADGKTAEVFDKIKSNMMQRIGGPIVSRKEAGESAEAAAQYQKQLMFMTSPAMGGMAKNSEQASKLLDALAHNDTGKLAEGLGTAEKGGATGKDEMLNKAMETGHKLQNVSNSLLNDIDTKISELAGFQSIAANKFTQHTVGNVGISASKFKKSDEENQAYERMHHKDNPLTGTGMFGGADPNLVAEDVAKTFKGTFTDPKAAIKKIFSGDRFGTKGMATGDEFPEIPNSQERTTRTLERSEKQKVAAKVSNQKNAESNKVEVSVSTTCTTCQRKIAGEEAQKAINHNHDKNTRQNFSAP